MNNDRGSLRGFTHILVPGSEELAELSLSGECHKIQEGKYYKSCMMGKQACVHVYEHGPPQQHILRVCGYTLALAPQQYAVMCE